MEPDTWSILFWDGAHRPRFIKSRWRDSSAGTDGEYETIAQDIERLIMSYVLRDPGRKIVGICLSAAEKDRRALAARLDKRMRMPCHHLDASEKFSMAPGLSMQSISPGMFAVSVPRR